MTIWSDWQDPIVNTAIHNPGTSGYGSVPWSYSSWVGAMHQAGIQIQFGHPIFMDPWQEWWQGCAQSHVAAGSSFQRTAWNESIYPGTGMPTCPTITPGAGSGPFGFDGVGQWVQMYDEHSSYDAQDYLYRAAAQRYSWDIGAMRYMEGVNTWADAFTLATHDPLFTGYAAEIQFESASGTYTDGAISGQPVPLVDLSTMTQKFWTYDWNGSWTLQILNTQGNFTPSSEADFWPTDYYGAGTEIASYTSPVADTSPDTLSIDLSAYTGEIVPFSWENLYARNAEPIDINITYTSWGGPDVEVRQTTVPQFIDFYATTTSSRWRYGLSRAPIAPPLRLRNRNDGVNSTGRLNASLLSSSVQRSSAPRVGSGNRYS